jgi:hypothetical protein
MIVCQKDKKCIEKVAKRSFLSSTTIICERQSGPLVVERDSKGVQLLLRIADENILECRSLCKDVEVDRRFYASHDTLIGCCQMLCVPARNYRQIEL